eukprot:gene13895-16422_t
MDHNQMFSPSLSMDLNLPSPHTARHEASPRNEPSASTHVENDDGEVHDVLDKSFTDIELPVPEELVLGFTTSREEVFVEANRSNKQTVLDKSRRGVVMHGQLSALRRAMILDTSKDGILDEHELADANLLEDEDLIMDLDLNNDGVIDEHEIKVAQELAKSEERLRLLGQVQGNFNEIVKRKGNYISMFSFIAFISFYFTLLFLQRRAFLAYDVTFTLSETVLPDGDHGGDKARTFTSTEQIYDWLHDLVSDVWTDPKCGDKMCEPPYEYASFGLSAEDNGCSPDCGANFLYTQVQVTVETTEWALAQSKVTSNFLASTQWNLCTFRSGLSSGVYNLTSLTLDLFTKGEDNLYDIPQEVLCWWHVWQQFNTFPEAISTQLNLLNAEWKLLLDAPEGGVRADVTSKETGQSLASLDFCRAPCTPSRLCAQGFFCQYVPASGSGVCMPCTDDAQCASSPDQEQAEEDPGPAEICAADASNCTRPGWTTISMNYYCEPQVNSSFSPYFSVYSVEECEYSSNEEYGESGTEYSSNEEYGESGTEYSSNEESNKAASATCELPFVVYGREFESCEWSSNASADLRSNVEQQRHWTCATEGLDLQQGAPLSDLQSGRCCEAAGLLRGGEGMYVEGADLTRGWYAFEFCGFDLDATAYSLRAWDKSAENAGWYGGEAILATHGNLWSNVVTVPSGSEGYCKLSNGNVVQNVGPASHCERGRHAITSAADCQLAASLLNAAYHSEASIESAPAGCVLYGGALFDGPGVYFNTHAVGGMGEQFSKLCYETGLDDSDSESDSGSDSDSDPEYAAAECVNSTSWNYCPAS